MERSVYVLGPGDVVNISMFGDVNRLYTATVSPEGTVLIPSVGVASVLGLNLNQAQARVRDLIFRFFRNVDVNLSLAEVRSFKVFVVGNAADPGVRVANSATRVSEVVPAAAEDGVTRRNVLLRRSSGDTLRVDLARFRQTGDLSANPTLREGDALVVPTVDERVQVFGRVHYPGAYEYRRGESLAELLSIANGGGDFPSDAVDTVRLTRFLDPVQREVRVFSRAEALGPVGQAFLLQPFDGLYIAAVANFKEQQTAIVAGQVVRPGPYPIEPNRTTVADLVRMAGGFTPDASLLNATLRRPPVGLAMDAGELGNVPPEWLSEEDRQILQIRSQADPTKVVVRFQQLFAGGANVHDQTLQAGDVLTIPRRRDEIVVLGAVAEPGIVAHKTGQGIDFFVRLAGGYSGRADKSEAVVIRAATGTRLSRGEVGTVEPGDQILIPFERQRTLLERVQIVQGAIGAISGAIVTLLAFTRLF